MRKFWALAAGLVIGLVMPGSCSAANSATMQVVVHASVLPVRYIVIAPDNQITEVISNTELPVEPQVYVGAIKPGHNCAMSPAVYAQYLKLLKQAGYNHSLIGVLYQATDHPKPKATTNSALATMSGRPHGLFFLKSVGVDFRV